VPGAGGVAEKPAPARIPADRDVAPHQLVQSGRRHVDRADQHQVGGVDQPGRRLLIVIGLDDERLTALAHPSGRRLDIDRQCQLAVDSERTRRGAMAKEVDLVGQTDPHQRAARAFRTVLEWRRDVAARGDESEPMDGGERL
jgi:hypothetical protein